MAMADNIFRTTRRDPAPQGGQQGDDPLAELARLIGRTNPPVRAARQNEAPPLNAPEATPEWPADARYADQIQQVNQDVRDSLLDIQSAAKLVESTHSNVDLANEALSEAQQRFHAGVSDNLPVSQAQSQTEQANDQYISALYQHNVAKLALARALGAAQTNYKDYLGGK